MSDECLIGSSCILKTYFLFFFHGWSNNVSSVTKCVAYMCECKSVFLLNFMLRIHVERILHRFKVWTCTRGVMLCQIYLFPLSIYGILCRNLENLLLQWCQIAVNWILLHKWIWQRLLSLQILRLSIVIRNK